MASVYEIVTGKIIEKLDRGSFPGASLGTVIPRKLGNTKALSGLNQMLLDPGEYLTFNQVKKAKGKVKKGARARSLPFTNCLRWMISMTKTLAKRRKSRCWDITGFQRPGLRRNRAKTARTGNIPPQPDWGSRKNNWRLPGCTPDNLRTEPAFYVPIDDTVSIPHKEDFQNIEDYYNTFFHELIHSTGHEKRLNRKSITSLAPFRSHEYSREELVAEIGAAMLCGQVGIEKETLENTVAYVQSWLSALKTISRWSYMQQARRRRRQIISWESRPDETRWLRAETSLRRWDSGWDWENKTEYSWQGGNVKWNRHTGCQRIENVGISYRG